MDSAVASLIDKNLIVECIDRLFVATDNRDWETVRGCLADSVRFDMTSLSGGEPATLTGRQVAEGWERGLSPIQFVHHQSGNFRVDVRGDSAAAFCYATAMHYRPTKSGRNVRVFVGSYDFELIRTAERWRISLFRFNLKFIEGNRELETDE